MRILLVNPPVYDFALHDYWLKPYGLLRIASSLKKKNILFDFFDFLWREHRFYKGLKVKTDAYGRGKYYFEEVLKPEILSFVPRKYKRYGIPLKLFLEENSTKKYDYIFISTAMTYWYPGVKEIIDISREKWGEAKIVVGGIAATLMPDFYKQLGADIVVEGDDWQKIKEEGMDIEPYNEVPYFEVYDDLRYGVIRITEGCPLRCLYCTSYKLKPLFKVLDAGEIADLVYHLYAKKGVINFVFYDDALLYNMEEGLCKFFEALHKRNLIGKIKFHTPNALHVRKIDEDVARLLKAMGFETIFLGVETVNVNLLKTIGPKLSFEDFEKAINSLKEAGFESHQITAYLFLGVPGQEFEDIVESLRVVGSYGVRLSLSEFSPIPGTPLGDKVIQEYNLKDPLLTNNSVFPILLYGFDKVNSLKNLKNEIMRKYQLS
jgi:radical SAM superfamily enzyme YgiQ (UPF0313 family)